MFLQAAEAIFDQYWDIWSRVGRSPPPHPQDGFSQFRKFPVNSRGQRLVPSQHKTSTGFQLGLWQNYQRQAYKKLIIAEDRVAKLEKAGMVWDLQVLLSH